MLQRRLAGNVLADCSAPCDLPCSNGSWQDAELTRHNQGERMNRSWKQPMQAESSESERADSVGTSHCASKHHTSHDGKGAVSLSRDGWACFPATTGPAMLRGCATLSQSASSSSIAVRNSSKSTTPLPSSLLHIRGAIDFDWLEL